jgi:hypothetical protein
MMIEVRVVIHFFSLLNTCDEDIRAQFDNTYGEDMINLEKVPR